MALTPPRVSHLSGIKKFFFDSEILGDIRKCSQILGNIPNGRKAHFCSSESLADAYSSFQLPSRCLLFIHIAFLILVVSSMLCLFLAMGPILPISAP